MALLTDAIKSWIGKEVSYEAPEELGRASIRYFTVAMEDDNPLYRNDTYAKAAGYPGIVAPPTLICESCQYADNKPNSDGYAGHVWDLPISNCRLIRVGNGYEFFRPVLPTDRISVKWKLESIQERSFSKGGTQLFVESVARYFDREGELLATNRETLVYQPLI